MPANDFIAKYGPVAAEAAQGTGVFPETVLAQAALESGNGTSDLATKHNNLFGIKATPDWKGATVNYKTSENTGTPQATTVKANFRSYGSPQESIKDHISFLQNNPRYAAALKAKTPEEQVQAIAKAGYATDANYGKKLTEQVQAMQPPKVAVNKTSYTPFSNEQIDALESQNADLVKGFTKMNEDIKAGGNRMYNAYKTYYDISDKTQTPTQKTKKEFVQGTTQAPVVQSVYSAGDDFKNSMWNAWTKDKESAKLMWAGLERSLGLTDADAFSKRIGEIEKQKDFDMLHVSQNAEKDPLRLLPDGSINWHGLVASGGNMVTQIITFMPAVIAGAAAEYFTGGAITPVLAEGVGAAEIAEATAAAATEQAAKQVMARNVGSGLTSMMIGGMQQYGEGFDDAKARGLTDDQANSMAAIRASVTALLFAVPPSVFLGRLSSATTSALTEDAVSSYLEKGATQESFANALPEFRDGLAKGVMNRLKNAGKESLIEAGSLGTISGLITATDKLATQQVAQAKGYNKQYADVINESGEQILKESVHDAIAGAAMGSIMGLPTLFKSAAHATMFAYIDQNAGNPGKIDNFKKYIQDYGEKSGKTPAEIQGLMEDADTMQKVSTTYGKLVPSADGRWQVFNLLNDRKQAESDKTFAAGQLEHLSTMDDALTAPEAKRWTEVIGLNEEKQKTINKFMTQIGNDKKPVDWKAYQGELQEIQNKIKDVLTDEKPLSDAEKVSENKGGVHEERGQQKGLRNEGSEDIQQPAASGAETGNEGKGLTVGDLLDVPIITHGVNGFLSRGEDGSIKLTTTDNGKETVIARPEEAEQYLSTPAGDINSGIDDYDKEIFEQTQSKKKVERQYLGKPVEATVGGKKIKGNLVKESDGSYSLESTDGKTYDLGKDIQNRELTGTQKTRTSYLDDSGTLNVGDNKYTGSVWSRDSNGDIKVSAKGEDGSNHSFAGQTAENIAYEIALSDLDKLPDADVVGLDAQTTTDKDIQNLIEQNETRRKNAVGESRRSKRKAQKLTEESAAVADEPTAEERGEYEKLQKLDEDLKAAEELVTESLKSPNSGVVEYKPEGQKESLRYIVQKKANGEYSVTLDGKAIRRPVVREEVVKLYEEGKGRHDEEALNEATKQLAQLKKQIYEEHGYPQKEENQQEVADLNKFQEDKTEPTDEQRTAADEHAEQLNAAIDNNDAARTPEAEVIIGFDEAIEAARTSGEGAGDEGSATPVAERRAKGDNEGTADGGEDKAAEASTLQTDEVPKSGEETTVADETKPTEEPVKDVEAIKAKNALIKEAINGTYQSFKAKHPEYTQEEYRKLLSTRPERLQKSGGESISPETASAIEKITKKAFPNIGIEYTTEGDVLGKFDSGKVEVNLSKVTDQTQVHELGHVWFAWAKKFAPELYKAGMRLADEQTELKEAVKKEYPELEGHDLNEEVAARIIGESGATHLEAMKDRNLAQKIGDYAKGLFNKLGDYLKRKLGIRDTRFDGLQDMNFKEFMGKVAKEILSGREISDVSSEELSGLDKDGIARYMKDPTRVRRNAVEDAESKVRIEVLPMNIGRIANAFVSDIGDVVGFTRDEIGYTKEGGPTGTGKITYTKDVTEKHLTQLLERYGKRVNDAIDYLTKNPDGTRKISMVSAQKLEDVQRILTDAKTRDSIGDLVNEVVNPKNGEKFDAGNLSSQARNLLTTVGTALEQAAHIKEVSASLFSEPQVVFSNTPKIEAQVREEPEGWINRQKEISKNPVQKLALKGFTKFMGMTGGIREWATGVTGKESGWWHETARSFQRAEGDTARHQHEAGKIMKPLMDAEKNGSIGISGGVLDPRMIFAKPLEKVEGRMLPELFNEPLMPNEKLSKGEIMGLFGTLQTQHLEAFWGEDGAGSVPVHIEENGNRPGFDLDITKANWQRLVEQYKAEYPAWIKDMENVATHNHDYVDPVFKSLFGTGLTKITPRERVAFSQDGETIRGKIRYEEDGVVSVRGDNGKIYDVKPEEIQQREKDEFGVYFPTRRGRGKDTPQSFENVNHYLDDIGSFRTRTPGGDAPLLIRDYFQVQQGAVDNAAKFGSWGLPFHNADVMTGVYGKGVLTKAQTEWYNKFKQHAMNPQENISKLEKMFYRGFVGHAIGLNPFTALKHLSTLVLSNNVIPQKYLVQSFGELPKTAANLAKNFDILRGSEKDWSPLVQRMRKSNVALLRMTGGNPELMALMDGNAKVRVKTSHGDVDFSGKDTMNGMKFVLTATDAVVWSASEKYVADAFPHLKDGTPEHFDKVEQLFMDGINDSQPAFGEANRSMLSKGGVEKGGRGTINRAFTLFSGQLTAQWNAFGRRSIADMNNPTPKNHFRTARAAANIFLANAAMVATIDVIRQQALGKKKDDISDDFVTDFIREDAAGIPFLGRIAEEILDKKQKGYWATDINAPVLQPFNEMTTGIANELNGKDGMKHILNSVAEVTGIPGVAVSAVTK